MAFLCQVAAKCANLEEATAAVEQRIPKCRVLALLDTLRYIEMGGRVSRATAMIGTMLDLKPLLLVANGEQVKSVDRVRTRSRAIPRMVEFLKSDLPVEHEDSSFVLLDASGHCPHLSAPDATAAAIAAFVGA